MASPEAKYRMLERERRRLRIIAASVGSEEELERFEQTRNQPTLGDPEMAQIFSDRAVADLLQSALEVEIEEDDLSEEGQLYRYNAQTGESEPYKSSAQRAQEQQASTGQSFPEGEVTTGDEVETSDEEVEEAYDETDVIPGSREASSFSATPAARKKADELGVDLNTVSATGSGGRITSADVERAAADDSTEDSEEDSTL